MTHFFHKKAEIVGFCIFYRPPPWPPRRRAAADVGTEVGPAAVGTEAGSAAGAAVRLAAGQKEAPTAHAGGATQLNAISQFLIFKVIFKEFRISIIVGAVLALTNGVRILIQYHNPNLALVIALSLIATVIISKLIGCILPLVASKVHLDPAIMASPLITTLVDTFSILIYFNIASLMFRL